jgi:hypothetical protein
MLGHQARRILLAVMATGLLMGAAFAQQVPAVAPNPPQGGNLSGPFNPLSSMQFWLCALTVGFGLIVLAGQFYLLRRVQSLSADDIVKNCSISIVIVGAMILIIAGYDSQQTAQAFGLFGTIIGYLLGRSSARRDQTKEAVDDRLS